MSSNQTTTNYTVVRPWLNSGASEGASPTTEAPAQTDTIARRPSDSFSDTYIPNQEILTQSEGLIRSAVSFNTSVQSSSASVDVSSTSDDFNKSQIALYKEAALNYWVNNLSRDNVNLRAAIYINDQASQRTGTVNYRDQVLKSLVKNLINSESSREILVRDENGTPTGETMSLSEYGSKIDDGITMQKYINDPAVRSALLQEANKLKGSEEHNEARTYNREYSNGATQTGMAALGTVGTVATVVGAAYAGVGMYAGVTALAASATTALTTGIFSLAGGGAAVTTATGFWATAGAFIVSNPVGWVVGASLLLVGAAVLAKAAIDSGKYIASGRNDFNTPLDAPGCLVNNFLMGLEMRDAKDFVPQH